MKNLLSRDEYLQKANEGFIKNTIRKGIDKIKSLFKIGVMKVKNFLAMFDSEGKVLPVVSLMATIDKASGIKGVTIYTSDDIKKSVVAAGGQVSSENSGVNESTDYEEIDESVIELENRNLMSMINIIKEHCNGSEEQAKEVFEDMVGESWEGVVKKRVSYVDKKELSEVTEIDVNKFEKLINKYIDERSVNGGKSYVKNGKMVKPSRNMLVFGAPGIGKSTVPNLVVKKFNSQEGVNNDPSKMISIISINCALISEGDFMMPTMPKESDIIRATKSFSKAFPQASEYIEGLDDEQIDILTNDIQASAQFKSTDAPKSWLPSYRSTGNKNIDMLLDAYANGGVYEDEDGYNIKTGSGGIILFDEFLRAESSVFDQMMNFFLDRKLQDWKLGSKWTIIACSNRPCDDMKVDKVWKDWNKQPASKDRQSNMYQLIPDPEGWKKWARGRGYDELLLKFIFDPSSRAGDEYPRWHTMVNGGAGDSQQVEPITPRRWEDVMNEFNKYEVENDFSDISQMTRSEINSVLDGKFDKSFIVEILNWLDDHMNSVNLDDIIKDPKNTYLPKKFIGEDQAKAGILIKNLWEQFENKFGEHPEELTDDILSNIIIWFGMNYKEDVQTFFMNFFQPLTDLDKEGDNNVATHINSMMLLHAAWPERDIEESCDAYEDADDERVKWPENSIEKIKDMMREYFPWRIKGDKIVFFDTLKLDDDEE